MRHIISELFYWLGDLFHGHQWQYYDDNEKLVFPRYRTCAHSECHKMQFRTAEGFK